MSGSTAATFENQQSIIHSLTYLTNTLWVSTVCQTLFLVLATHELSLHVFILSLSTFPFDSFFLMFSQKSLPGNSPIYMLAQAWKLLISLILISSFDFSSILDLYFSFTFSFPSFFYPLTFLSRFLLLYMFFFFNFFPGL